MKPFFSEIPSFWAWAEKSKKIDPHNYAKGQTISE